MAATVPPNDEDRRRAALEALAASGVLIDVGAVLAAERAAPASTSHEPSAPGEIKPKWKRSKVTLERRNAPAPEPVRTLSDDEWSALEDLLPDHHAAKLCNREFLDKMLLVVVAGQSWFGVQGVGWLAVREKHRRERRRPERWVAVEHRVRLLFNDPMKANLERVCRFLRGDYSVRARRPGPLPSRPSKYEMSGYPRPLPPDLPHRGAKVRSRNARPQ